MSLAHNLVDAQIDHVKNLVEQEIRGHVYCHIQSLCNSLAMPRPLRLEYENAFHHVMNRGRNKQVIFHSSDYFEAFLATLKEASQRYDVIIQPTNKN